MLPAYYGPGKDCWTAACGDDACHETREGKKRI